jgi:Asp-tRNA(Asn)/Glu-tRNA(Gln) amidotransferase A subunit family amidase
MSVAIDILALPARQIPLRIAAGDITALDVTRAYLDRIAQVDGAVGAWAHLDPLKAEAGARDSKPGLLHGVPIAVKDVIDTFDLPTAYGSAAYTPDHQPPRDAAPVALARAEGAVILGKTVTTEFAGADPGGTRHPMRATHTPGGSSSGSCAAVGAGMVPLAFGTQTSGSTIRPAAFCGIAGYKPSFGLLDRTGVKPLADSLDHLGLLARDVRDIAFLAAALRADPDWRVAEGATAKPRLALFRTPIWDRASAAQQAVVERAAEAAAAQGAEIVSFSDPDDFVALGAAHDVVMRWEIPRALAFERLARLDLLRPKTRGFVLADPVPTAAEHQAALLQAAWRSPPPESMPC